MKAHDVAQTTVKVYVFLWKPLGRYLYKVNNKDNLDAIPIILLVALNKHLSGGNRQAIFLEFRINKKYN